MALAAVIFYGATVLFLVNFALGLLVQVRFVDMKPCRWLHHAIFFAVFFAVFVSVFVSAAFVSAAADVLVGFLAGASYRLTLDNPSSARPLRGSALR